MAMTAQDRQKFVALWAAVAGGLAFVLLLLFGYGFIFSLLLGLVIAGVAAAILIMRTPVEETAPAEAPPVRSPATETEPVKTTPAGAQSKSAAAAPAQGAAASASSGAPAQDGAAAQKPLVSPSKRLPGQEDLANRKGSWTYEAPKAKGDDK